MSFTPEEAEACRRLVDLALEEDLESAGDRTSDSLIPASKTTSALFVARTPGVLAGVPAVELVAKTVSRKLRLETILSEGRKLRRGSKIARLTGPLRAVLAAERTALNFLQHLSGIATQTRRYVDVVAGLRVEVLDTRKTIPGWRRLEKYAVRMGGGTNHRLGLYDGVLIKDNHLAGLGDPATAVRRAVELARSRPENAGLPIEVEVDSLSQLKQALEARADIVLLDNMTLDQLRQAAALRDRSGAATQLEASGGVSLESLRAIAETGVERISIGALTHSAVALDIGLDYE